MTTSWVPQTIRIAGLMTVIVLGSVLAGCDKDSVSTSAGSSNYDDTLPPERPMLEASSSAMGSAANPSGDSTASIKVSVKLSPRLAKQAAAHDDVFIFARAAQGPRMPLAIIRKQVHDLPVTVTLDDSLAMTPEMKLSDYSEVVVGARISRTGDALAQPGDLEGYSAPMKTGSRAVEVTIAGVYTGKPDASAMPSAMESDDASGFVHPKTTQPSDVRIPPEVKAKWKSVELSITANRGEEQRTRVAIGEKVAVANTGLSLSVSAFVPAFMIDAGVVTSSSNNLDNPAVQLQLRDRKGKIAEGWVFQNLPEFNSYTNNKVNVRLLSAEAK